MSRFSSNRMLAIPLYNFKREYLKNKEYFWIGRESAEQRMMTALKASHKTGGCFLVGGYRGVGKTELTEKVIGKLKDYLDKSHNTTLETIRIDLGVNNEISTQEILSEIAERINSIIVEKTKGCFRLLWLLYSLSVLIWLYVKIIIFNTSTQPSSGTARFIEDWFFDFNFAMLFCVMFSIQYLLKNTKAFLLYRKSTDFSERIRFSRAFNKEAKIGSPLTLKGLFSIDLKKVKTERNLSPREILQELKTVIQDLHSLKLPDFFHRSCKVKTLILFDEIDKISNFHQEGNKDPSKSRKELVDSLLGGLKPLLNQSSSIFIFISGREIVDAFHSEAGYTSVLYEGVFDEIFYVPSLLSDHTDGNDHKIHSMVSQYVDNLLIYALPEPQPSLTKSIEIEFSEMWKSELNKVDSYFKSHPNIKSICFKDFRNSIDNFNENTYWSYKIKEYIYLVRDLYKKEPPNLASELEKIHTKFSTQHDAEFKLLRRMFIRFLTLHSRGNFKRLVMMISEYILADTPKNEKTIEKLSDITIFGGTLNIEQPYLLFKHGELSRIFLSSKLYSYFDIGLARQLALTDDKILVSSLIAMLDITRFHGQGFTRAMLERTVAGIDVHSESNLMHVTDDFINATFYSIIRRTNNNLFTYRFYQTSEIEFSVVSKVLGPRASSFEYSLDSAEPIRRYYEEQITLQSLDNTANSRVSMAKLQVILGDIYLSERSYDKSFQLYTDAINLFKAMLRDKNGNWKSSGGVSLSAHYSLIETILKKGLLEEIRENNQQAFWLYTEAKTLSHYSFERFDGKDPGKPKNVYEEANFYFDKNEEKASNKPFAVTINKKTFLSLSLNATLAQEHLAVKQSGFNQGKILGNLEEYIPGKTNCDYYTKILLLHYYTGQYRLIVEKTSPIIKPFFSNFLVKNKHLEDKEKSKADWKNTSEFINANSNKSFTVYTYANALFCMLLEEIKNFQASLNSDENIDRFIVPWIEMVIDMASFSKEDVDALYNADSADLDNITPKFGKDGRIEKVFNSKDFIWSLFLMGSSAQAVKDQGRLALAAEMYLSVLLNWIAILELVPKKLLPHLKGLEKFSQQHQEKLQHLSRDGIPRPEWLDDIILAAEQTITMSNSGAFRRERLTLFGKAEADSDHSTLEREFSDLDTLNIISGAYNSEFGMHHLNLSPEELREKHRSLTGSMGIWYRANSGNYLLIFGVWEQYCRCSILKWLGKISYEAIDRYCQLELLAPPFGTMPRVKAIYLWLRARKASNSIFSTASDEEALLKNIYTLEEMFECYMASINLCKLTSKSDDPDTFPPKSTIYLNMYEIICHIFGKNDDQNQKVKQELQKRLSKSREGFHKAMLNPVFLKVQVEKHLNESKNTVVISSNAYRRETRHKYYLYDDFEDPMYIAEWAFLNCISAGANLHLDHIRKFTQPE